MDTILKPRIWFFLVALGCSGLLGFALYLQHSLFLDPCPLCVFQRIGFMWIGAVALLAFIHNPSGAGRWIYGVLLALGGVLGAAVAGRHLWLQNLPPDQVPDCGMGLNYMLDTMPFTEVLTLVFQGSGECAEVAWRFLGVTMPGWTLVWYTAFTVVTMVVLARAGRQQV
jgi:disulfide bond formation protein DsbB